MNTERRTHRIRQCLGQLAGIMPAHSPEEEAAVRAELRNWYKAHGLPIPEDLKEAD